MKKLITHMPLFSAIFVGLFACAGIMPEQVRAQTGLISVSFEQTPLFQDGDIKPGHTITKTVSVENLSSDPQDVYLELVKCAQTKGLGDVLHMSIRDSVTTLVSPTALSALCDVHTALTYSLGAGNSKTYTVTVMFPPSSDNEYQAGTAGFDFCVGFVGGALGCDGSTDGGDNSDGGIGGSSGGSSGTRHLTITNERPENVDVPPGRANLVWTTNLPATSKVVCRPAGTLVTFTLADTDTFGYPIALEEVPTLSETHLYALGGLSPGTYYCRVASRLGSSDGWTVSDEFPFTIVSGEGPGVGVTTFAPTLGAPQAFAEAGVGDTFGVGETGANENAEESSGAETTPSNNAGDTQAAAAFLAFPELADLLNFGVCGNEWWVWIIVGLTLLYATLWRERFVYAIGIVSDPIRRFFMFGGFGFALSLLGWMLGSWFALVPVMIGSVALLIAGGVDYFLMGRLIPARRLVYDTLSLILALIVALILTLFMPWLCSVIPLVIIIVALLIRLALHFLRLRRNK